MEQELAEYIFHYCSSFFNEKESKANDHHFGVVKFTPFKDTSGSGIQDMKKNFISDDPEVLKLLADGFPTFLMNTAERIYTDHKEQLKLNLCPKCNKIARTPKAKQCRFCGHDWHNEA